jgi:hypothetical protein
VTAITQKHFDWREIRVGEEEKIGAIFSCRWPRRGLMPPSRPKKPPKLKRRLVPRLGLDDRSWAANAHAREEARRPLKLESDQKGYLQRAVATSG